MNTTTKTQKCQMLLCGCQLVWTTTKNAEIRRKDGSVRNSGTLAAMSKLVKQLGLSTSQAPYRGDKV